MKPSGVDARLAELNDFAVWLMSKRSCFTEEDYRQLGLYVANRTKELAQWREDLAEWNSGIPEVE